MHSPNPGIYFSAITTLGMVERNSISVYKSWSGAKHAVYMSTVSRSLLLAEKVYIELMLTLVISLQAHRYATTTNRACKHKLIIAINRKSEMPLTLVDFTPALQSCAGSLVTSRTKLLRYYYE